MPRLLFVLALSGLLLLLLTSICSLVHSLPLAISSGELFLLLVSICLLSIDYLALFLLVSGFCFLLLPDVLTRKIPLVVLLLVLLMHVKACCTAPSLNPNMKPQKNKAYPKRPQFFLPGLLKVALLPGPGAPGTGGTLTPPKSEKARQCVSLRTNAVLEGRGMRAHAPRSGDRKSGDSGSGDQSWSPGPETKRPGGHP